jgi:spore coat protein U-like protein
MCLKKTIQRLAVSVPLVVSVIGAPAWARQDITYSLSATVDTVCAAYHETSASESIDFAELALTETSSPVTVDGGEVAYTCNAPGGFDRTISSSNGGYLCRAGAGSCDQYNRIAYTVSHDDNGGSIDLSFAAVQLTSDQVDTFAADDSLLLGEDGDMEFVIQGVRSSSVAGINNGDQTTVYAGSYADTVTVTITAN